MIVLGHYTQCFYAECRIFLLLCWVSHFLIVVLSVTFSYCYAECGYAGCRYAECHSAECRGAIFTGWSSTMVPLRSFPWVLTRTASPAWGRPNSGLPSTYSGKMKVWNIPDRRFEKVVKTNVCREKGSFHSLQNRLPRWGGQLYLAT